jgi:high affinity sulfate transporter 1
MNGYSPKMLKSDAFAGITLAAYAIPVSMAYASLAGLPLQYGIYGYLIGGIFYAIFGTGRQLAVGPTSAISLLIGATIATLAKGDVRHWGEIASLTALVMGVMSLSAYFLRLNSIINFISESVLMGFKAGAAILIALSQLPKLFGVKGGGSGFFEQIGSLIRQFPETNFTVLIFGIATIVLLITAEKFLPGRPTAIILVMISILLISFTSLMYSGFSLVGYIPSGFPHLSLPSLNVKDIDGVIPLAFACFLLAYIESVAAAKSLANQGGYEIDSHQELLALAAANITTAFGHGYPVTGGLSQSAVNSKAGAKTTFSLVFASATIALCLLFLTGTLKNLPEVVLTSILLVAISGLVDIRGLKRLWKVSRMEFTVAIIALTGVIVFGILKGVILAAVASIILMLRAVASPHIAFLGRIPGTKRYTDVSRHPDNQLIPGLLIFRVESSLFYFNVENIRNHVWTEVLRTGNTLKCVIWDFSTSPNVDLAGARLIRKLYLDLKGKGIMFKIAEAHSEVRDILRIEEIEDLLGHISRKVSIDDIVNEFSMSTSKEANGNPSYEN